MNFFRVSLCFFVVKKNPAVIHLNFLFREEAAQSVLEKQHAGGKGIVEQPGLVAGQKTDAAFDSRRRL